MTVRVHAFATALGQLVPLAVPARSRRIVRNRGSSDEAEGAVKRRPLLGLGVALILSAASGGCGHEDEKPAFRVVDLPGASLSVAVGEGAVWVANFEDDTVLRIDPRSMKVVAEIPVGRDPFSVATGEGAVWVVNRYGTATRVDPRSNRAVEEPLVDGRLMAVAVGEGSVWAFEARVGQLLRIDPQTNTLVSTSGKIAQRGPATSDYAGVAVGAGAVWVVSPGEGTVVRMDPRSNRRVASIRVGAGPVAVAVAGSTVWVANSDDGTVTRIDARTNQVVGKPISVGGRPVAVAVGGGAVWVASGTGGVTRLDPESGTPVGDPITVPGRLQGLAFGEGAAWAVDQDAPALTRIEP
jgi:YVTN family beta-propeller protein